MLGPLALAASGMEFTALSSYTDLKTSDLGDSIRNICNSTLTLLYTVALLIWGLAVNRQRAWRTDGGTASFGAGSVGIGEVEDRAERVAKKRKREERKKRKLEKAERLKKKLEMAESGEASFNNGGDSDVLENMRRFTGKDGTENQGNGSNDSNLENQTTGQNAREEEIEVAVESRPSRSNRHDSSQNTGDGAGALESIAIVWDSNDPQDQTPAEQVNNGETRPEITATAATDDGLTVADSSNSNSTNPTGTGFIFVSNLFWRRMKRLRLEHVAAARVAAGEQAALREQVMNHNRGRENPGLRNMMMGRDETGETSASGANHGKGSSQQQVGSSSIHSNHPRIRSLNNGNHQGGRPSTSSSQNRGHHHNQPDSLRTNGTEDRLTGTTALDSANNSSNQNHSSSDDVHDERNSRDRTIGEVQDSRQDEDEDAWWKKETKHQ
ncbi:hypothetical protein L7F22_048541 [Adiantum nelumboides]|nr:hypothetical protein [Adiantum nelumboides]